MDRRKFIKTSGITSLGIFTAGCAGTGPGNDSEGSNVTNNGTGIGNQTNATNGTEVENETDTANETDVSSIRGEVGSDIPDNVKVVRHNIFQSGNQVGVTGAIKNTGDRAFEELEVEVTLRDGDTIIGEFVDTNEQEAGSLAAGAVWQFVVIFTDENLNQATGYTIGIDGELADGPRAGNETQNGTDAGNGTQNGTD